MGALEVEELLEEIDVYDYISQYVELEEKGGQYWGLSPFKVERTPSFSVNTDIQRFFDYSSGLYGDLVAFVQYYHGVNFNAAVKMLMDYAGIEDNGTYHQKPGILREMKKYIRPRKKEKEFVHRKILSPHCMDAYTVNEDALSVWVNEGVSREVLERHQVRYNPTDDSLVFPLFDSEGHIVSICSRTLCGRMPKYIPYHRFDGVDFLYWEYQNRQNIINRNEVIVFEGAKSVMVAESFGYDNCVSTQTSHMNDEQFKILMRLGVNVVIAYDKGVDVSKDVNIKTLARFTKVEYIQDEWSLLKKKDAPIDYGKDIFDYLYERRHIL